CDMKKLLVLAFLVLLPLYGWSGTVNEPEVTKIIDDLQEGFAGAISTGVLGPPRCFGKSGFTLGLLIPCSPLEYTDPDDDKLKEIPIITPSVYARIGLGICDIGGKYCYIPEKESVKSASFFGLEVRKRLLKENALKPEVSVSLTYNSLEIGAGDKDKWKIDWEIKTKGVKLIASKKVFILSPYVGIGKDWYSAKIKYTINELSISDRSTERSDSPLRLLVGCELDLLLLKLSAEINKFGNQNIYSVSLRI
ncbi:hypothetical protein KKG61_07655, partial [bacterium]|nr:hypothetical protein [bacterium]MBU1599959.1 hypothetical protein [bacterium]MBU2462119.1 hypothetical protein [bacterium]